MGGTSPVSEAGAAATVRRAVERGIRYFDTAAEVDGNADLFARDIPDALWEDL